MTLEEFRVQTLLARSQRNYFWRLFAMFVRGRSSEASEQAVWVLFEYDHL